MPPAKKDIEPKYNKEHYDFLLECAAAAKEHGPEYSVKTWNDWVRRRCPDRLAWKTSIQFRHVIFPPRTLVMPGTAALHGPDFVLIDFRHAFFHEIDIRYASMWSANFRHAAFEKGTCNNVLSMGANFQKAVIHGTSFMKAHFCRCRLESARFEDADLRGADFSMASVNTSTLISGCKFDKDTYFGGVDLAAIRLDPGVRPLLEYNIRRRRWEQWYPKQCWPLRVLVHFFWLTNDYGLSAWRILIAFGVMVGFFSFVTIASVEHHPLAAIATVLGNMTNLQAANAPKPGTSGHALAWLEAFTGYLLLASLITRLAILFQMDGPIDRTHYHERTDAEMLRLRWRAILRDLKHVAPKWLKTLCQPATHANLTATLRQNWSHVATCARKWLDGHDH